MASAAQIEANRSNAACSCGPNTPAGKARSSRNRLKFGLFSTQNCVRPEETAEYTRLSKALWRDLNPVGPVEQMLAVEIVRAAWRLHRCATAEAEDGASASTQASVDRARASTHNSMRRLLNDLRSLQSDRWLRAEVLRDGFDEAYFGIDTHRVIKGLADNERLKSLFIASPIGIDPVGHPGCGLVPRASRPVVPPSAPTIRTQSVGQASQPVKSPDPGPRPLTPDQAVPRNAPCPCHSGLKYKRCCGTDALPVLTGSAAPRASEAIPLS